jgi:predicted DsbA family dithiol-disulfide isomerase
LTYCYLEEPVVDRLQHAYGSRIDLAWKAFELRPEPVPLPRADDADRRRRWAASVLPMAAERGLIMQQPPIIPRTRLAFQAVELARDRGRFDAMHRAVFEAFFRDGRDIGRIDVLAGIAASVDLPPDVLTSALETGVHLDRVMAGRLARDLGVTGVPRCLSATTRRQPNRFRPCLQWLQAAVDRALSGESLRLQQRCALDPAKRS